VGIELILLFGFEALIQSKAVAIDGEHFDSMRESIEECSG